MNILMYMSLPLRDYFLFTVLRKGLYQIEG